MSPLAGGRVALSSLSRASRVSRLPWFRTRAPLRWLRWFATRPPGPSRLSRPTRTTRPVRTGRWELHATLLSCHTRLKIDRWHATLALPLHKRTERKQDNRLNRLPQSLSPSPSSLSARRPPAAPVSVLPEGSPTTLHCTVPEKGRMEREERRDANPIPATARPPVRSDLAAPSREESLRMESVLCVSSVCGLSRSGTQIPRSFLSLLCQRPTRRLPPPFSLSRSLARRTDTEKDRRAQATVSSSRFPVATLACLLVACLADQLSHSTTSIANCFCFSIYSCRPDLATVRAVAEEEARPQPLSQSPASIYRPSDHLRVHRPRLASPARPPTLHTTRA